MTYIPPTIYLQNRLTQALKNRDLAQVEACLEQGANPNCHIYGTQNSIWPPMYDAAEANFIPGLEALHAAGGKIDSQSYQKITPLMIAASHGHVEVGRWLLRHGADLGLRSHVNWLAMNWALRARQFDFLDMVLQERPSSRTTHLVDAAREQITSINIDVAQWLLAQGISPDLMDSKGHRWLGIVQTKRDHITKPITELLLAAGANPNVLDEAGSTPLHKAMERQVVASFVRLLNAGADPDLPNKDGRSVRHLLQLLFPGSEIHSALIAWESSREAHHVLQDVSRPSGLRPL